MKAKSTGLLTDKQAQILEMVLNLEGKTQAEMAQELGIAQPEFSRLLRRARKNVQKANETVLYLEEIGYSARKGEKKKKKHLPLERCIECARQVLYTNTLGGELSISEADLRETLRNNYSLSDPEVSNAVAALIKRGIAGKIEGGKLNLV